MACGLQLKCLGLQGGEDGEYGKREDERGGEGQIERQTEKGFKLRRTLLG